MKPSTKIARPVAADLLHGGPADDLRKRLNQTVFRIRAQHHPQRALEGAATRTYGDARLRARRTSTADVTPLVAATNALHAAGGSPEDTAITSVGRRAVISRRYVRSIRRLHPAARPMTIPISGANGTSVVRLTRMPRHRPTTAPTVRKIHSARRSPFAPSAIASSWGSGSASSTL
jgi:hypothetical protein